MIKLETKGDFSKLTSHLERLKKFAGISILDTYGKKGVEALAAATPVDTGLTARSWYYEISQSNGIAKLSFFNSNIQNGVPIAIILQYGHGTGTGGWVEGRDYINPALRPIFDELANDIWREVTSL